MNEKMKDEMSVHDRRCEVFIRLFLKNIRVFRYTKEYAGELLNLLKEIAGNYDGDGYDQEVGVIAYNSYLMGSESESKDIVDLTIYNYKELVRVVQDSVERIEMYINNMEDSDDRSE